VEIGAEASALVGSVPEAIEQLEPVGVGATGLQAGGRWFRTQHRPLNYSEEALL
jgi:hypothetical protein